MRGSSRNMGAGPDRNHRDRLRTEDPPSPNPSSPPGSPQGPDEIRSQAEYILDFWNTIVSSRRIVDIEEDLSDGVLVAEFVAKYLPDLIHLEDYQPSKNVMTKVKNWSLLNVNVLKVLGFQLSDKEIINIARAKPGAVIDVTSRIQVHIARITDTIEHSLKTLQEAEGHSEVPIAHATSELQPQEVDAVNKVLAQYASRLARKHDELITQYVEDTTQHKETVLSQHASRPEKIEQLDRILDLELKKQKKTLIKNLQRKFQNKVLAKHHELIAETLKNRSAAGSNDKGLIHGSRGLGHEHGGLDDRQPRKASRAEKQKLKDQIADMKKAISFFRDTLEMLQAKTRELQTQLGEEKTESESDAPDCIAHVPRVHVDVHSSKGRPASRKSTPSRTVKVSTAQKRRHSNSRRKSGRSHKRKHKHKHKSKSKARHSHVAAPVPPPSPPPPPPPSQKMPSRLMRPTASSSAKYKHREKCVTVEVERVDASNRKATVLQFHPVEPRARQTDAEAGAANGIVYSPLQTPKTKLEKDTFEASQDYINGLKAVHREVVRQKDAPKRSSSASKSRRTKRRGTIPHKTRRHASTGRLPAKQKKLATRRKNK